MSVSIEKLLERFCPTLDEEVVRAVAESGGDSDGVIRILQEFYDEAIRERQKTYFMPTPADSSLVAGGDHASSLAARDHHHDHEEHKLKHGDRNYDRLDSLSSVETPVENRSFPGTGDPLKEAANYRMPHMSCFSSEESPSVHGRGTQSQQQSPGRTNLDLITTSLGKDFQSGLLTERSTDDGGTLTSELDPIVAVRSSEAFSGFDSSLGQKRKLEAMGSGESYKANEPLKKSLNGRPDMTLHTSGGYSHSQPLQSEQSAGGVRRTEGMAHPESGSFPSGYTDGRYGKDFRESVVNNTRSSSLLHEQSLHMPVQAWPPQDFAACRQLPVQSEHQGSLQRVSVKPHGTARADCHQVSREWFEKDLSLAAKEESSTQMSQSEMLPSVSRQFEPTSNSLHSQQALHGYSHQVPLSQDHAFQDHPSAQNGLPQRDGQPVAAKPECEPKEKILYILRGCPGSGKSTLARTLAGEKGTILSTDDYFMHNGRYEFEVSQLGRAHEWNQNRASRALRSGVSPVVIDNTNTQAWEMKPYVTLGKDFQYRIEIREPETPWKWSASHLAQRNTHGVSEDKIRKMIDRFEFDVTVQSILQSTEPRRPRPTDRSGRYSWHSPANGSSHPSHRLESRRRRFEEPLSGPGHLSAIDGHRVDASPGRSLFDREREGRVMQERLFERHCRDDKTVTTDCTHSGLATVASVSVPDSEARHAVADASLQDVQPSAVSSLESMSVSRTGLSVMDQHPSPVETREERDTPEQPVQDESNFRSQDQHGIHDLTEMVSRQKEGSVTLPSNNSSDDSYMHLRGAATTLSWLSDLPSTKPDGVHGSELIAPVRSLSQSCRTVAGTVMQESVAGSKWSVGFQQELPAGAWEHANNDKSQPETNPSVGLEAGVTASHRPVSESVSKTECPLLTSVQESSSEVSQNSCAGSAVTIEDSVKQLAFAVSNSEYLSAVDEPKRTCSSLCAAAAKDDAIGECTQVDDKARKTLGGTHLDFNKTLSRDSFEGKKIIDDQHDFRFSFTGCRSLSVPSASDKGPRSLPVSLAPSFMFKRKTSPPSLRVPLATRAFSSDTASAAGLSTPAVKEMISGMLSATRDAPVKEEASCQARLSSDSFAKPAKELQDEAADESAECLPSTQAELESAALQDGDEEELGKTSADGLNIIHQDIVSWEADSVTADQAAAKDGSVDEVTSATHVGTRTPPVSLPLAGTLPSEAEHGNLRSTFDPDGSAEEADWIAKEQELGTLRMAFPLHSTDVLLTALTEAGNNASQAGMLILDDPVKYPESVADSGEISPKLSGLSLASVESTELDAVATVQAESSPPEQKTKPSNAEEEIDQEKLIMADEEFARLVDAELNQAPPMVSAAAVSGSSSKHPLDLTSPVKSACGSPRAAVKIADGSPGSAGVSEEGDLSTIIMELPVNVAFQLQNVFGSVGVDLAPENLHFKMSTKLARNLYRQWVNSLRIVGVNVDDPVARQRQEQEDARMARRLAQQDEKAGPSVQRNLFKLDAPHLPEIMSEQMAEQLQREDMAAHEPQHHRTDAATQVKRVQLFKRFPAVPRDLLEDIFAEEQYDVDRAIVQVCALIDEYPVGPSDEQSKSSPLSSSLSAHAASAPPSTQDDARLAVPLSLSGPSSSGFGGCFQNTVSPKYDDYRAEERLYNDRQKQYLRLAQEEHSKGRHVVAQHYSKEAAHFGEKKQEARRLAMQAICSRQTLEEEDTIDLHHLHVDEAVLFLESSLAEWQQKGKHILNVITGRGLHSQDRRPRVKPAVLNFLTQKQFRYDFINDGCVRVYVK